MAFFKNLKTKLFGTKTTKYDNGLKKSRELFSSRIRRLAARYQIVDENYFAELEEILISNDVCYKMALTMTDEIRHEAKLQKLKKPQEINEILLDKMFAIYTDGKIVSTRLNYNKSGLTVFLVIGVNGNGKTTSIAKIANQCQKGEKKPLLIAADTYRAGAVAQLRLWAEKLKVGIYEPLTDKQDPASVVYQGLEHSITHNYDVAIIDTAGRLENKSHLMQELQKINRIITKKIGRNADEVLLVLDATTGQNGVIQAQEFTKIAPVSGIILSKMDGSAKGGIILAIKEYLDIPVKLIGLGEQKDDIEEFDLDQYLYNLTRNIFNEEQK